LERGSKGLKERKKRERIFGWTFGDIINGNFIDCRDAVAASAVVIGGFPAVCSGPFPDLVRGLADWKGDAAFI